MNIKQFLLLGMSAWIAWGWSDHVLAESVRGFFDGATPAHKAHSNQVMKTLLLSFLFTGFVLSAFRTAGWFDVWKQPYFSSGLKGAGLGIAAFNIFAIQSFITVALLVLYIVCFGVGHGIGIVTGKLLRPFLNSKQTE